MLVTWAGGIKGISLSLLRLGPMRNGPWSQTDGDKNITFRIFDKAAGQ